MGEEVDSYVVVDNKLPGGIVVEEVVAESRAVGKGGRVAVSFPMAQGIVQ